MKIKNLKRSKLFWVFAIFVGFFMVTQIANRIQLHALKSSAFADASVGGINPNGECISFYVDVATCQHGWGSDYYGGGGGGGGGFGGGISEYDQITQKQETEQLCAWFPSLVICGSGNNNSSAGAHDIPGTGHASVNAHATAESGARNNSNSNNHNSSNPANNSNNNSPDYVSWLCQNAGIGCNYNSNPTSTSPTLNTNTRNTTNTSINTNTRVTPSTNYNNYNTAPYSAPQYTDPRYRYQENVNRCGASNVQWNGGANTWQCPGANPTNPQTANPSSGTGVVDSIVNTAKKFWPF